MTDKLLSEVLPAAKFYARATATRAIRGFIPEPNPAADENNWNKTKESVREHCIAMVTAIAKAAALARLQGDGAVESAAAALWRSDNPDASVFSCDAATKEVYRERISGNQIIK